MALADVFWRFYPFIKITNNFSHIVILALTDIFVSTPAWLMNDVWVSSIDVISSPVASLKSKRILLICFSILCFVSRILSRSFIILIISLDFNTAYLLLLLLPL